MHRHVLGIVFGLLLAGPVLADGASNAPPAVTTVTPQSGLLPTNAVQSCGPATGSLTSGTSTVTLTCAGAANYLVQITPGAPNLNATIAFADSTTAGPRRIFKTGVGALEVSSEKLDGTQGALEYRTSGGGDGLTVSLPAYTSGSATVRIVASYNPVMTFINGPVHTTVEAALRAGRDFIGSSGVLSLTASQYALMTITNPSGSGRNLFVHLRQFSQSNSASGVLTGRTYANPSAVTANPVTVGNNRSDSAVTSVAQLGWSVGAANFANGTAIAAFLIPNGGVDEKIEVPIMLAPGQTRGYAVQAPAGLGATATVTIDLVWFEEGIN